jgi:hypothetical protein
MIEESESFGIWTTDSVEDCKTHRSKAQGVHLWSIFAKSTGWKIWRHLELQSGTIIEGRKVFTESSVISFVLPAVVEMTWPLQYSEMRIRLFRGVIAGVKR